MKMCAISGSKEATTPRQEVEHLCIQHSSTKVEENTRYDYILKWAYGPLEALAHDKYVAYLENSS